MKKARSDSKSGVLGVSYWGDGGKMNNRWIAAIMVDGQDIRSYHPTKEQAAAAYLEMKAKHHPFFAQTPNS